MRGRARGTCGGIEMCLDVWRSLAKKMAGESLEPFLTGGDQGGGFPPCHWQARRACQTQFRTLCLAETASGILAASRPGAGARGLTSELQSQSFAEDRTTLIAQSIDALASVGWTDSTDVTPAKGKGQA